MVWKCKKNKYIKSWPLSDFFCIFSLFFAVKMHIYFFFLFFLYVCILSLIFKELSPPSNHPSLIFILY